MTFSIPWGSTGLSKELEIAKRCFWISDEMGHVSIFLDEMRLDEMRLDEMGLDKMGCHADNSIGTYTRYKKYIYK